MAKQLTFKFEGKEYTLEFTRRTVQQMENEGFVAKEIDTRPMSLLPALFAGAFKAHHRLEKAETIDRIFKYMPDKEALIGRLAEMYNEPIMSLMDEPDESSEKNVEWSVNW